MWKLFRDYKFSVLYLSSACTSAAIVILILSHATNILRSTQSATLTSLTLISTWGLSVVLAPYIGRLCNKYNPGHILAATNACSVLIMLSFYQIDLNNLYYVLPMYSVIGTLRSLNWNACNVAVKLYLKKDIQPGAFSFIGSARTLGSLIGGIILTYISAIESILFMSIILHCIALLQSILLFTLKYQKPKEDNTQKRSFWLATPAFILRRPYLYRNFCYTLMANGLFFGLHQSLRVAYPVQALKDAGNATGLIQIASTSAGLLAAIFITHVKFGKTIFGMYLFSSTSSKYVMVAAAMILSIAGFVHIPVPGTVLYFLFYFCFRAAGSFENASLYDKTKADEISNVGALANALGLIIMKAVALLMGQSIDILGLKYSLVIAMVICISVVVLIEHSHSKHATDSYSKP